MGLGHDGLRELLAKPERQGGADLDLEDLSEGDLVMCLNGHGDKMKVIGHKGLVLAYLKLPNKARIMGEAIRYIPATFGGEGFDYDRAVKQALTERLAIRQSGPLKEARAKVAAGL